MSQPEQRWKHTMCPSLWLQILMQRSHGLIVIQIIIILTLILWTISGLTVSDHHFDPLPKQELPHSCSRHTFILPLTQTELVCCSFHCCSSLANTQSSVHLSLHPGAFVRTENRTLCFCERSLTKVQHKWRKTHCCWRKVWFHFQTGLYWFQMNHTIVQLWTRTFWQLQVWPGFLWSITLYVILSHQSPKTFKTHTCKVIK